MKRFSGKWRAGKWTTAKLKKILTTRAINKPLVVFEEIPNKVMGDRIGHHKWRCCTHKGKGGYGSV